MNLAEFDRLADAAAKRAEQRDRRLEKTRARRGVGVPTREPYCGRCDHHLAIFDRPVWIYAVMLPREAPPWNEIPKPSREWGTKRCGHCKSTNVYVIA